MDFSSAAIEMAFWNHPFVLLIFSIWAIARGSIAVAGEIEKGTMDLVLSRPVQRSAFLASQVLTAVLGLTLMASAMVAGNLIGSHYHTLIDPATVSTLAKPALNLVVFGWAIFGYTFVLSTLDIARWRPNLIGSVATLAGFIALVLANIPQLELGWLAKVSIFKAYDPVEVVVKGESLAFNVGVLGLIGLIGVGLGFVIFARRDLPAGS
jgi:ABC-2 type transport system permease protein